MTRFIVVRHGQSQVNRDHLVPGQSLPSPLTELGRDQAKEASEQIASLLAELGQWPPTKNQVELFASDAVRALQTAGPIAAKLGVDIQVDALLREQDLGTLEGKPTSQLAHLPVPEGSHITEIAWGGKESIADVWARMDQFVAKLRARKQLPEVIVLVSHGDAMRVFQTLLAGRCHREVSWDEPGLAHGEAKLLTEELN